MENAKEMNIRKAWGFFIILAHDFYADGATPCKALSYVDTDEPGYGMYYAEELTEVLADLCIYTDGTPLTEAVDEYITMVADIDEVSVDTLLRYERGIANLFDRLRSCGIEPTLEEIIVER